jgi:diacylglycerol kinase (ATP)
LLSIDENGRTALHHAALNGQMDIVRFLIASAPVTILDMVDADS